jgi:hypothetical protein
VTAADPNTRRPRRLADVRAEVDQLRAESDRLLAEHHALAEQLRRRDAAWEPERAAALARQRTAYTAQDEAWDALDTAQDAFQANPADPDLAAAVTAARANLNAAQTEANAARDHAMAVLQRQLDESATTTSTLLELGERARAAQDAYFAADWAQARTDQAAQARPTPDEYAQDVLRRCQWAQTHNNGHPSAAWSTGEQLAVALVLRDRVHLAALEHTPTQAAQRLVDDLGLPPDHLPNWLAAIRTTLSTQPASS